MCFENPEDAKKAVDELNNVEDQRGFTWYVQPAMSKS